MCAWGRDPEPGTRNACDATVSGTHVGKRLQGEEYDAAHRKGPSVLAAIGASVCCIAPLDIWFSSSARSSFALGPVPQLRAPTTDAMASQEFGENHSRTRTSSLRMRRCRATHGSVSPTYSSITKFKGSDATYPVQWSARIGSNNGRFRAVRLQDGSGSSNARRVGLGLKEVHVAAKTLRLLRDDGSDDTYV
jgi:hypothetical protein